MSTGPYVCLIAQSRAWTGSTGCTSAAARTLMLLAKMMTCWQKSSEWTRAS